MWPLPLMSIASRGCHEGWIHARKPVPNPDLGMVLAGRADLRQRNRSTRPSGLKESAGFSAMLSTRLSRDGCIMSPAGFRWFVCLVVVALVVVMLAVVRGNAACKGL